MSSPMFYKPSLLKRILIIVGIAVLTLGIIFLAAFFARRYVNREIEVPINDQPTVTSLDFELDPGIHYESIASESALFFYSAENVKVIDNNGTLKEELSLKMNQPDATVKGHYTLFFDRGNRSYAIFNKTKQVAGATLEDNILLASVNKNGYALIVTEGHQHKCAVSVYSPEGKELFKWNSGNLTVVGADIADNDKDITVSALNTDEGTIKTHVIMFNIAKEKPFTNDLYEDALYPVIRYSGGYLYCIGSKDARIYNGYGKCIGVTDFKSREVLRYELSNDVLILAFAGSTSNPGAMAEIKSFNHKGDEIGSFPCMQAFDFLDATGNTIVLNHGRSISVLNNHCQEKRQINLGFDLRDFIFLANQNKGIGITAAGAEMIQLGA